MKNILFVLALVSVSYSVNAVTKASIIANNNLGSFDPVLALFDGEVFRKPVGGGAYSPTEVNDYLNDKFPGSKYDAKKKEITISNDLAKYVMSASQEDFENGLDTRVSQVFHNKKEKKLTVQTLTFRGNYLRSITQCFGMKETSTVFKIKTEKDSVYCATATPKICQKIVNTYNRKAINNQNLGSPEEMREKMAMCTSIMKDYSEILKSYSEVAVGVRGSFNTMVDQENSAIKEQLKKTEDATLPSLSLSSLNDVDAFSKASETMLSSMNGLEHVNTLIETCQDNLQNFDPKLFGNNEPVPSKTPSRRATK